MKSITGGASSCKKELVRYKVNLELRKAKSKAIFVEEKLQRHF